MTNRALSAPVNRPTTRRQSENPRQGPNPPQGAYIGDDITPVSDDIRGAYHHSFLSAGSWEGAVTRLLDPEPEHTSAIPFETEAIASGQPNALF